VGASSPGREFRPGEQGGIGTGNTTVGKDRTVTVVAGGHSVPLGLYMASVRLHES
jgi:hypothetical protein